MPDDDDQGPSDSESNTVRVNFGRPMPLFPLNVVTLMPHAVLPIHIFEPRYRQLVKHAIDGPGQIAMGVFRGERWKDDYEGSPPLREAVCVGQIVKHHQLSDGRFVITLHGVCRARIIEELPTDEETLYRRAMLEPIGLAEVDEESLSERRQELRTLLTDTRLRDYSEASNVVEYIDNPEVPTSALFELVSFTLVSDEELRYRLLAEPDPARRSALITRDLTAIGRLLDRAAPQVQTDLPKGVTYN